jgi:hypothetical protein
VVSGQFKHSPDSIAGSSRKFHNKYPVIPTTLVVIYTKSAPFVSQETEKIGKILQNSNFYPSQQPQIALLDKKKFAPEQNPQFP